MSAYELGVQSGRHSMLYGANFDNPYADCACSDCASDASEWNRGFSDGQESFEKENLA